MRLPNHSRCTTGRTFMSFAMSFFLLWSAFPVPAVAEALDEMSSSNETSLSIAEDANATNELAGDVQSDASDYDALLQEVLGEIREGLPGEASMADRLAAAYHALADAGSVYDDMVLEDDEAALFALELQPTTAKGITLAFADVLHALGMEAEAVLGELPIVRVAWESDWIEIDIAGAVAARMESGTEVAEEGWTLPEPTAPAEEPQDAENEEGEAQPTNQTVAQEEEEDAVVEEDGAEEDVEVEGSQKVSASSTKKQIALTVQSAVAAGTPPIITNDVPATTSNVLKYAPYEQDAPRKSYLHVNASGALERVEYVDGTLLVQTFTDTLPAVDTTMVIQPQTYTLSDLVSSSNFRWGGFYSGASYNYVITGQINPNENDSLKVFRISKYNKDWTFVSAVEFADGKSHVPSNILSTYTSADGGPKHYGTKTPFMEGSVVMLEQGNSLHIRSAHQTYSGHQATMHLVVNTSTMTVTESLTYIYNQGDSKYGYVSHSFAQRLAELNGNLYALDHGDASPRTVTLKKLGGTDYTSIHNILTIGGEKGLNYTGVTIGGMSTTASGLLTTGATIDQNAFAGTSNNTPRNVYVSVTTPGSTFRASTTTFKYLTSYAANGDEGADIPKLVKVNNNRFLVMWERMNCGSAVRSGTNVTNQKNDIDYVFVDGNGNIIGNKTYTMHGYLSDCDPVLCGDLAVWYAEDVEGEHEPIYYTINVNTGEHSCPQIKGDLRDAKISSVPEQGYLGGTAVEPKPTVTLNGVKLEEGTDYRIEYENNRFVGTATLTVRGINGYSSSQKATFAIGKGTPVISTPFDDSGLTKTLVLSDKSPKFSIGASVSTNQVSVTYSSSNPNIATVASGVVTAKAVGTATITIATSENDNWNSATKTITVHVIQARETPAISVPDITVEYGSTAAVDLSAPEDIGKITYKSGSAGVFTVSADGVITPVGCGSATLTVSTAKSDKYAATSTTATITVVKATPVIDAADVTIAMGEKTTSIEAKVTNQAGEVISTGAPTLSYASDNEGVVKVNASSGALTPQKTGTATITITSAATNKNWESVTKAITVHVIPGTPTFSDVDQTIEMQNTTTKVGKVTAGAGGLTFASSDENVVTVSSTGYLIPVHVGEATVTVHAAANDNWGEATTSIQVTVAQGHPTITASNKTVKMGNTVAIGAKINEGTESLTYVSSDNSVVTADADGIITPHKVGTATISISAEANADWNSVTKDITVTVNKGTPTITAPSTQYVGMGAQELLDATITEGAGKLTYSSANESVVTIDANGVLTPVATGSAVVYINAAATDNWNAPSQKQVTVRVVAGTATVDAPDSMTVQMGTTGQIEATASAGAGNLTYTSKNTDIATVSSKGVITPVSAGTALIVVGTAGNANYASASHVMSVEVTQGTPAIAVADISSLAVGATAQLSVTASKGVDGYTYESSNESVFRVDANGKVTAVGVGQSVVTVTSLENDTWASKFAVATVTVTPGTPTITASDITVHMGHTAALDASVNEGAGSLSYTSSNTDVATVSSDGVVTPKHVGTATVTIKAAKTTNWQAASAQVTVTVRPGTPTISVLDEMSVAMGHTATIAAQRPTGAGALSYQSANDEIVAVNKTSGLLTPVSAGVTTVTVSCAETSDWYAVSQKIQVTVSQGHATISAPAVSLAMGETDTIEAQTNEDAGKFIYQSSDESVVKVSSSGKLTPVHVGTTKVMVGTEGTASWATDTIAVGVTVTKGVPTLTGYDVNLPLDGTAYVSVTGSEGASGFTYEVTGDEIVSVGTSGKITPSHAGTTTVHVESAASDDWEVGSTDVEVTVTKGTPTIVASNKSVAMGKTINMGATATEGAGAFAYQTSDASVVTVDEEGVATPHKVGKATVTVVATESNDYVSASKDVTVTVTKGTPTIVVPEQASVVAGQTATITATSNDDIGGLTFKSSNTGVVTVDLTTGELTGIKTGSATITVTSASSTDWNAGVARVPVVVSQGKATVSVATASVSVAMGQTGQITATANTGAGVPTFASADESIAKVDANGKITPVSVGTVKVSVSTKGNTSYAAADPATVTVTVSKGTPSVTVNETTVAMGKTATLNVNVGAGAGALSYQSLSPAVVEIDSATGKITPLKVGTATVRVTSANTTNWNSVTATGTVTVTKGTPTISVSNKSVAMGKTVQISPTVTEGASTPTFACSGTYARVDSPSGAVTPIKVGKETVTVSVAENENWLSASKTMTVTVTKGTPQITVTEETVSIGSSPKVNATITSGVEGFTYTSGTPAVATVDANTGVLNPLMGGKTRITVKAPANDNWYAATGYVYITVTPGTPTIDVQNMTIAMGEKVKVNVTANNGVGKLSYTSSNAGAVMVDSSGNLTPTGVGTAVITVKSAANSSWFAGEGTGTITVVKGTPTIKATAKTVKMGKTVSLGASASAGAGTLSYASNDENILTVSNTGVVTPVHAGTGSVRITSAANTDWNTGVQDVEITVERGEAFSGTGTQTVPMGTTPELNLNLPENVGDLTLRYKADNPDIVDVDADGTLHPKQAGSAKGVVEVISDETNDWLSSRKVFTITVSKGTPTITVSSAEESVQVGSTITLQATVSEGANAPTFKSSSTSIAKVDENTGVVTPVKAGTATITISATSADATNYYAAKQAQVKVTVTQAPGYLNLKDVSVPMGTTLAKADWVSVPENTGALTYESLDESKVKVNSAGVLTPVSAGTTRVYVTSKDSTTWKGTTDYATVTVVAGTPTVKLSSKTITTTSSTASISASGTSGLTYTYTSSNPSVVQVDANTGKLTGLRAGTATITATSKPTTNWLSTSASATVTVTGITKKTPTITAANKALPVGSSLALGATVSSGAGKLAYKSSNTGVVTVDAAGNLTGKSVGNAVITITSAANTNWNAASKLVVVSVVKGAQPMAVQVANKTVKYKKVKKKAQTVKGALKVSGAQGAVSYKKASGSKKFTVNAKTGKITVKKKTKKGTYTIGVTVTASGNSLYNAGSITAKVKITIK